MICTNTITKTDEEDDSNDEITGVIRTNTIIEIDEDNNSNYEIIEVIHNNEIELSENEGIEGTGVNNNKLVNAKYVVTTENNDLTEDRNQVIELIQESKKYFSYRDCLKAKMVQCFQYAAGMLSDTTIIHSTNTNLIKIVQNQKEYINS